MPSPAADTSSSSGPCLDELDQADMKRLGAGGDAALNNLMERHAQRVFHFLLRMLDNEDDANDLAQETFVRVYQNRTSFRPGAKFSTWLYTIAANLGRNHIRWRQRHPATSLDAPVGETGKTMAESLPDGAPGIPETLMTEERAATIRSTVADLPDDLRLPLILAEFEDRSQKEIAEILECSVKAVETRIYRARQRLRTALAGFLGAR